MGDYPLKLLFFPHFSLHFFRFFVYIVFAFFFYIALGGRFFHRFFFALFLLFQFHFWNLPKTGTTNHKPRGLRRWHRARGMRYFTVSGIGFRATAIQALQDAIGAETLLLILGFGV